VGTRIPRTIAAHASIEALRSSVVHSRARLPAPHGGPGNTEGLLIAEAHEEENHAAPSIVHKRVGGAEVDGHVWRTRAAEPK
jgi:hypothetical protein